MTTKLFERQVALYATYHRDRRNRVSHSVGISAIVFSLLVLAAAWRVPVGGVQPSAAWIVAGVAALGWLMLDMGIGLATIVALVPMIFAADWIAGGFGQAGCWTVAAVLFVSGWVFQLVGHAFEGRRPALFDNLFQAFIGPMFIMAEFLVLLGLRRTHSPAAPAA